MYGIRRAAIVSCSVAISLLMCEFSIAQTRIYRTVPSIDSSGRRTLRYQRVITPSTSRRVVTPTQRSTSSRSTRSSTAASRVLATKSEAESAERRAKAETADDDIPAEALLSERGAELSAQLRQLRYTESTLGSRHPSLPQIKEQIVSIRRTLKSEDSSDPPTPDASDDEKEIILVSNEVLDSLSKDDLKQLVVRLAKDLSKIRQRVDELEEDQLAADES